MAIIMIHRRPSLYAAATGGILASHAALCYPAVVSRGYPPTRPIDLIAIFLAPIGMILPPLFDDFRNATRARLRGAAIVAAGFCFIWGVVDANLSSARPHAGHLLGLSGLLASAPSEVAVRAAFYFPLALLFFYCLQGVASGFWSALRGFHDRAAKPPASRDLA